MSRYGADIEVTVYHERGRGEQYPKLTSHNQNKSSQNTLITKETLACQENKKILFRCWS